MSTAIKGQEAADIADWRDEVERLIETVRTSGDGQAAQDLVTARHLAARAFADIEPSGNWPRPVVDLFPGETGLVEVAGSELTAQVAASAIQHHGCLLVRGLLDGAAVERIVA